METIQGISQFKTNSNTALTIGTFDGVHVGHKRILERLTNNAKKHGLQSAVLTFFPHPRMILQKDSDIKLLNTLEEKQEILEKMGVDYLIVHPFTKSFSRLTALEFVRDILVNRLNVKSIVIGYDHRFGRNRNANIKDLVGFGATYNFNVEEIPAQEVEEVSVSSTKIRNALLQGDIVTANAYLGYPYLLSGTVVKGKGLGRKLGFPTANLAIKESYKLIPKNGVYLIEGTIDGKTVNGMMNIGYNPTVEGKAQSIETHIFNWTADLYEKKIQVRLLKKLRDEHKFDSVELLVEQLKKDQATAVEFFQNEND